MRDKTLVWGLHTDYINNKEWIEENFNVEGYYDADESRLPQDKGIKNAELAGCINDFDFILITADPVSIMIDLRECYDIPLSKIKVLFYEIAKKQKLIQPFYGSMVEDAVILTILDKYRIKPEDVTYLEIGTNDPVRFNNTFGLYQKGARGVLVDPLPSVGELVGMIRPDDEFVNAAVSDNSGEDVAFFACKSSTVSSLAENHHKKWDGKSHNETRKITVPLIGVNELLKKFSEVPTMILIDAEGYDEIILKGIDYSKYSPLIIMTEIAHMSTACEGIDAFMSERGYLVYSQVDANRFYIRGDKL